MATYSPFTANMIQLGRETVKGTAVPATVVYRGPAASIEDGSDVVMADENIGLIAPSERSYIPKIAARLAMPDTEATFEQLPHLLEASWMTATPTGLGPYVYAYVKPYDAAGAIKTYTVETGNKIDDGGDAAEMAYAFIEDWTLSGKANEPWKMAANWVGRQRNSATLTALSVAAVEEILFNKTTLKIDASGGTIGTTAIAGVLVDFSLSDKSGLQPVFTADGALYFTAHKSVAGEMTGTLTLEMNSDDKVAALRTAKEAQTVQLIRLAASGSASRAITVDVAAKLTKIGTIQNSDGNTTVQVEFKGVYSSTDALYAEIEVTNTLATLP